MICRRGAGLSGSAAINAAAARAATQTALTIFGTLVPGGDWAAVGAAAAMAPAQQAQAAQNVQQRMQQGQEMMRVLPQLMRGQRVIELAQARKCGWIQQAQPR